MKLGQKNIFRLLFITLLFGQLSAQTSNLNSVVISDLRAEPNVGSIKVSWKINSDINVAHYDIYRGTNITGPFTHVGTVVRGNSSFEDMNDLFKTANQYFCYKVIALNSNGDMIGQSEIIGTSYNSASSTAKRTWGSIKAMFR
jgi:hypothetical protein